MSSRRQEAGDAWIGSSEPSPNGRRAPAPTARLVAGSGLQFIELSIATDVLALTYCRFVEDTDEIAGPLLIPLQDRPDYEGVEWHPATHKALRPEETLWLTGYGGVEPFLGAWLPIPYLRYLGPDQSGAARYDHGPGNWARLFLTPPEPGLRQAARIEGVIAFDTRLEETSRLDGDAYLAPNADDARLGSQFHLVSDPTALSGLLSEKWVDMWLAQSFATWQAEERRSGSASLPPRSFALEHIARYLTLLRTLDRAAGLPRVRFFEGFADRQARSTGVDLVIDVDDDRTTALTVDRTAPAGRDDLAGVETLRLRELTAPSRIRTGPFRTFGEFDRPSFGNAAASRLSGRPNAFYWPSLMRIGEEAQRLSLRASAATGLTGLGDLRSMLDQTAPRAASWRFSREDHLGADPGPVVAGEVMAHLAEDGEILGEAHPGALPALRPRFSASSMVSLFFAEMLLHAISQINDTARRSVDGDIRHLQQIVVTCPAEADDDKRRLLRDRVAAAVDLVWSSFGWPAAGTAVSPPKPQVALGLDRGLAAQLLYLYDEVHNRFGGNLRHVMGLARGSDGTSGGLGGLTIASLDLGSSTTGLAVVDYELGEGAVQPRLMTADRCSVSARTLIDGILPDIMLPAIARHLGTCGHPRPTELLEDLLAPAPHSRLGAHFAGRLEHRILRPAAEAFLEACRDAAHGLADRGLKLIPLATLVADGGGRLAPLAAEIDEHAAAQGARGFSLGEVPIPLRPRPMLALARRQLDPLVDRVTEIVREQSCDLLLLTGPFAHTGWIKSLLLRRLPLAPHHILDMGERRLGIVDRLAVPSQIKGRPAAIRLHALVGTALAGRDALGSLGLALLPPAPGANRLPPPRGGLAEIDVGGHALQPGLSIADGRSRSREPALIAVPSHRTMEGAR